MTTTPWRIQLQGMYGKAFLLLLAAHLALKLWMGTSILDLKLTGDENAYADAAMALSNLLRSMIHLAPPNLQELRVNVIGNGWFMPGMSALLAPLYLVIPEASVATVRLYLGCLSLILWLWAVLTTYSHLGRAYAYALMVFPSLVPLWVAFSFTAWGDLYAGLILVILLCHAFTAIRRIYRDGTFGLRTGLWIGVLAALSLYLRSNVSPLIILLFGFLAFAALTSSAHERRLHMLGGCVTAVAAFVLILAPWSLAASRALRAPVLTTTTVPLSLAITFGDRHELCFGTCGRGNTWYRSAAYSRTVAADGNTSELVVQKEMARHAMRKTTAASYAADVFGNFGRYAFNPGSFAHLFAMAGTPARAHANAEQIQRKAWLRASTTIPYFIFMTLLMVAWLTVATHTLESQITSLLVKAFSAAMFIQPFVHVGGGRYWSVFGPMAALAAGFLWSIWRRRDAGTVEAEATNSPTVGLVVLQWTFIAGVAVIATIMTVLAAKGGYFRP